MHDTVAELTPCNTMYAEIVRRNRSGSVVAGDRA